MQLQDGALICQVEETGPEPRADRAAGGGADQHAAAGWQHAHGHGLWLARQVADELSVLSGPSGTCATVVFALG